MLQRRLTDDRQDLGEETRELAKLRVDLKETANQVLEGNQQVRYEDISQFSVFPR